MQVIHRVFPLARGVFEDKVNIILSKLLNFGILMITALRHILIDV
jgi:hypothetical protein